MSSLSNLSYNIYDRASNLPPSVVDVLRLNARKANVILPTLEKALARGHAGQPQGGQVWITCSYSSDVKFVLAITQGYMGPYPAFIFTTIPFDKLTDQYIRPFISMLAQALAGAVPMQRIFSVFAVEPVTLIFVEEWARITGIQAYPEPYYAAKISHCTLASLDSRSTFDDAALGYYLRPAVQADIPAIAKLCLLFAAAAVSVLVSCSFLLLILSLSSLHSGCRRVERGKKQRYLFIIGKYGSIQPETKPNKKRLHRLWHAPATARQLAQSRRSLLTLVCATAVVRSASSDMFANSKLSCFLGSWIFSNRAYASLLTTEGKESVVLYVAHDNPAANHVYGKVGFAGLGNGERVLDVDPWMEIGFDRTKVVLGHW